MMRWASSNSETFDRCEMSPVWIMKDGLTGIALILPIASSSVPSAFGLAGLSKPTWLSLICRNFMPPDSAASAEPTSPSERGTPPEIVQSTPVPAQVMHSSTRRRLRSRLSSLWSCLNLIIARLLGPLIGFHGRDRGRGGFIPEKFSEFAKKSRRPSSSGEGVSDYDSRDFDQATSHRTTTSYPTAVMSFARAEIRCRYRSDRHRLKKQAWKDRSKMFQDVVYYLFMISNGLRLVSYIPQIHR